MMEPDILKNKWLETRNRMVDKELFRDGASLSIRCPTSKAMWFGQVVDAAPALMLWSDAVASGLLPALHAAVYQLRPDVGAITWGGGPFGDCLVDFGGLLPQVFDEQARHIGPMSPPIAGDSGLEKALSNGGNALLVDGVPLCFGTTCSRLALNMELFEKCTKAYVLAVATGGSVKTVPWLVRRIANSRLVKDQRRAAEAFAMGELPAESNAY
jgi:hypothetical protein